MTVQAVHYGTNADLIVAAAELGYIDGRVLDPTWGRGRWWTKWKPQELVCHDMNTLDGVDFTDLPYDGPEFDTVAFDPPYKLNGTASLGDFDNAYGIDGTYVPWQDRHQLIREGLKEAARVTKHGGHVLLKCQDQVCSGKVRWQTREFADYGEQCCGLTLIDQLLLVGTARPQPMEGRTQRFAHGRPSALLIFKRRNFDF